VLKQRLFSLKSRSQSDPALAPARLLWLVLLALAGPIGLCAQTNSGRPASSHYLLLVETSRAMSHRTRGVSEAVKEILDSNLKGEWRPGDTLAVWTFKEDSSTNLLPSGKLPLDAQAGSKTRLINFLQGPAYEKRDPFDQALPSLDRLVQGSNFTTVILVSAGDSDLQGTPFDDRINEAYRQWQEEQKKLRLPFITVLRAVHGKFTHWSVTPAQWPLELPPFPKEPPLVAEKSSKAPELAEKPVSSSALQLAISSFTRPQLPPLANAKVPAEDIIALEGRTASPTLPKPVPESKAPPPAPPAPAAVAARIEIKQPAASVIPPDQKPFELALADWEPFDEAMKRWPPAKELPALPKTPLPEATTQPASTASPIVSTKTVPPQEPNSLEATALKPLPEPLRAPASLRAAPGASRNSALPESLGAPASLPATILAERNAGSEIGTSRSTDSMGGQPPVEPPEAVIESKTVSVASAIPEVAAAPPAGFLRENAGALAALLLAGIATTLCFMNWLRSYFWPARARPVIPNLAHALMAPTQSKLLGPGQPAQRKPSPRRLRATSP